MKNIKSTSLLIRMSILLAAIIVTITIVTSMILGKRNEIKTAIELSQFNRDQLLKTDKIFESLFELDNQFKEYCITSKKSDFETYKQKISNLTKNINQLRRSVPPQNTGQNEKLLELLGKKENEESKYAKLRQLTDSLLFTSETIEGNKAKTDELQVQIKRLELIVVPKVEKVDTTTVTKTIGTKKKGLLGRIKTFIVGENTEQQVSTKVTVHSGKQDSIRVDSITSTVLNVNELKKGPTNESKLQKLVKKNLELKEAEIKLLSINNRLISEISKFIYDIKNTVRNNESSNNTQFIQTIKKSASFLQYILMILIIMAFGLSIYIWRLAYVNDLSQKRILSLNEQVIKDSKDKDKFFSIISHDLMNPFNAILGFSELLHDSINSTNKEDSLEYATIIKQSSKRIFGLLQNLLLWAKTQNSKIKYSPEKINVEFLVNDSLSALLPSALNKGIEIRSDVKSDLIAYIDYNMISSVLRNLVSNAIKFSSKDGQINLNSYIKDKNLFFEVSDTGVGMTPNQLDELFKLDKTITTKGTEDEAGSGLGLIICKEFVDAHGGTIEIESKQGAGSKFIVRLPL